MNRKVIRSLLVRAFPHNLFSWNPSAAAVLSFALLGNALASTVSVSVSPSYGVVQVGQTMQFTATVMGTANTAVTWQVDNANGGAVASGTVSPAGLYTAPSALPTPATATITARPATISAQQDSSAARGWRSASAPKRAKATTPATP